MKEEIIEFTKHSIEKIREIDDIIDNMTEDIKDLTDTASDLIKPIKAFNSIYYTARKIKFKHFVRNYSSGLNSLYPDSKKIELYDKMMKYLSDDKNLNFIYDTIDSALNAKSINCASILGYLSSEVLSKQIDIGFKELAILNSLRNLNDIELDSAILVLERTHDWTIVNKVSDNQDLRIYRQLCEYAVQKLKSLQILDEATNKAKGSFSLGDGFVGTYIMSDISKDFFDLIKDSGYYETFKSKEFA